MTELWSKALKALEEAELLYRSEHYDGAGSRAYYAMFSAARVLLADVKGITSDRAKKHATVHRLFSKHFVKSGPFSAALGRGFVQAFDVRMDADYGGGSVNSATAREVLDTAQEFMATARTMLEAPKPVS